MKLAFKSLSCDTVRFAPRKGAGGARRYFPSGKYHIPTSTLHITHTPVQRGLAGFDLLFVQLEVLTDAVDHGPPARVDAEVVDAALEVGHVGPNLGGKYDSHVRDKSVKTSLQNLFIFHFE